MAEATGEIQLRSAERTWATIRIEPDGSKVLDHQLTEAELEGCPPLLPYHGTEQLRCLLTVCERGPCVEIIGANGNLLLRLMEGYDGDLVEVVDPSGDAQLAAGPGGDGTIGEAVEGSLTLRLCRIKSDPKVMVGKPVVRGTRITVEHILRRFAGGATEDELLGDHPRLTREDIREALTYAANHLHPGRPVWSPPQSAPKS